MPLLIIDTEDPDQVKWVTAALYDDLLPHGSGGATQELQDRVKIALDSL